MAAHAWFEPSIASGPNGPRIQYEDSAGPGAGPADRPSSFLHTAKTRQPNGRPSPDMQSVSRRVLGARDHPSDSVFVEQCYPERQRSSHLLPYSRTFGDRSRHTVPFARERGARHPSTAAAAKTLGWVSLPQPLDLAAQGQSDHIRVLKIELHRLSG